MYCHLLLSKSAFSYAPPRPQGESVDSDSGKVGSSEEGGYYGDESTTGICFEDGNS